MTHKRKTTTETKTATAAETATASETETMFLGEKQTFVGIDNKLIPELQEIATGLSSTISAVVNEALDRWLEVEGAVVREKFEEDRTKGKTA